MRNIWILLLLKAVALSSPVSINVSKKHRPVAEPGSAEFWFHISVSAILVLAGGVFAGLTLGLMGLDDLHLRVLATSSEDENERNNAKRGMDLVFWIIYDLSSFSLEAHVKGPSLDPCVIFGIIPQAICVRYGLAIGAKCAPLVYALMWILAPIAYPIAKLLDWVLGGEEHTTYKKAELKSFLQFHRTGKEPLRDDEIAILNGVLELNTKNVETIMTPLKASPLHCLVLSNSPSCLLSGYSRFPVHTPEDPTAFIGLLLIKKLLTYDPSQALPVSAFPLSILPEAHPSINCFQALDYFQTGRAHLLLISTTPGKSGGAIGLVTLEDIIEEIISEEIVDETDIYEDNQTKRAARRKTTAAVMKGILTTGLSNGIDELNQ
ncbi:hypothetical protein H0H93_011786 [Arthromyces matolae]|nr:hypothetical protein H0H93_011786 [Arthromyces matolae]